MSHYYLLPFKYEINKGSNQNKKNEREKQVYHTKKNRFWRLFSVLLMSLKTKNNYFCHMTS